MNSRKIISALFPLLMLWMMGISTAQAQSKIKDTSVAGSPLLADSSAVLELESTQKGFLPPRMTTAQRDAIVNPKSGLVIYNTDEQCINQYNDITGWTNQCGTLVVNNETINNIKSPSNGQIVYNTDSRSFEYYDAVTGTWKSLVVPAMTASARDSIKTPLNGQTIFNTDENCINTYFDSAWISICGEPPRAVFTIDSCGDIVNSGVYVQGTPLTSGNYLTMTANVSKAGSYAIFGSTTNGYGFSTQGTFFGTGKQTIFISAQGTPVNASQSPGDTLTLLFNGTPQTVCNGFTISVVPNIATYSLDCGSVFVAGQYSKGTALDATNYITLRVTVASPGFYNITTTPTNGVSFAANGSFAQAGSQTITLTAVPGSNPTVNLNFPVTINSNSTTGNTTCSATIPVILPTMTFGVIGIDGTYSIDIGSSRYVSLTNTSTFSPTGIVKCKGLTQLWAGTQATAVNYLNNNNLPDIIFYCAYIANADVASATVTALVDYVNRGGVLIFMASSNGNGVTQAQTLLSGIFPSGFDVSTANINWQPNCTGNCPGSYPNDDNAYMINNTLSNDPVINGPFGNLAGKYWGEDNGTTGTVAVQTLPSGSVQICSAANNWGHQTVSPDASVVWYNNNKNFLMLGDAVGASNSDVSAGSDPALYSATGMPLSKQYGNGDNDNSSVVSPFCYNAALEMNIVNWAIVKAATSGINPH